MTRSSPGVKRIAAILDFMADHPAQAFALTDLVRALKLSRATCHALLTGLVEVGYLFRTSDKSYVLGPALARVGKAAGQSMSPLQVAQPEMRSLADEYDVVCSAIYREGDIAVVRERASSVSHVGFSMPLGSRLKLRTPFSAPFLAWSPQEAAEWLETVSPPPTADQRAEMEAGMGFARRHGFNAMIRNPAVAGDDRAPEQFFIPENNDFPVLLATEIDPATSYEVSSITAPVMHGDTHVEFVMGMMGFGRTMTGREIFEAAAKLCAACQRISSFLG